MKLRLLDTFAGIGGFSLGLERTGFFETVAFCEIEDYPRQILAKNWPDVYIHDDIRTLRYTRDDSDEPDDWILYDEKADHEIIRGPVDVISGGFPCQDLSLAGNQAGIEGERSGLWSNLSRLIGEVRPRYAIVENVTALLSGDRGRWFGRVLGDLAALGYSAEWHSLPASSIGAPHRRDRVWIIAYPDPEGLAERAGLREGGSPGERRRRPGDGGREMADTDGGRREGLREPEHGTLESSSGRESHGRGPGRWRDRPDADTIGERLEGIVEAWTTARPTHGPGDGSYPGWWTVEPDLGRVAHGIPDRVDRLKCLGNAIVPQIAQLIGYAIADREGLV